MISLTRSGVGYIQYLFLGHLLANTFILAQILLSSIKVHHHFISASFMMISPPFFYHLSCSFQVLSTFGFQDESISG